MRFGTQNVSKDQANVFYNGLINDLAAKENHVIKLDGELAYV